MSDEFQKQVSKVSLEELYGLRKNLGRYSKAKQEMLLNEIEYREKIKMGEYRAEDISLQKQQHDEIIETVKEMAMLSAFRLF